MRNISIGVSGEIAAVFVLCVAASAATLVPCTLTPSSPTNQLIKCNLSHMEFSGSVLRNYGVFIPVNYVAGQSGMILKVSGTSHGIANDCQNKPAGNESAGWLPWLNTVPAPAPVLVCPEGVFDAPRLGYNNGERWNTWGHHAWNWVNGTVPNDLDFFAQIVQIVQSALQLNRKFMAVTVENPDTSEGSIMASEFAAYRPDLVSSLSLYNDRTFSNIATPGLDSDGTAIINPTAPVNVVYWGSMVSGAENAMCGSPLQSTSIGMTFKSQTMDDVFSYWLTPLQTPTVTPYDFTGTTTNFCSAIRKNTTLEYKHAVAVDGTVLDFYRLVGNATGVPWCSYDYYGADNPTVCSKLSMAQYPHDFRVPPANCRWQATGTTNGPCNHYMPAPGDMLGVFYQFMVNHQKP